MGTRGWYDDPAHRHESRYWDGRDWTAMVSDGGVTATDALGTSAAPPREAPSPLPGPAVAAQQEASEAAAFPLAPPPPPPPATARRPGGRVVSWVVAVVLVVVGVLGFVLAGVGDSSTTARYKADQAVLGEHNAATSAEALNAQVARVKAAYDDYVSAAATVRTRHEAVTDTFNEVVTPLDPTNLLGITRAKESLPKVIGAYQRSLARQQAAAAAYFAQLAHLKAMGAR